LTDCRTEDTKLRKDKEIGGADVGNPLDDLSTLHNYFHGLAALEDFIIVLRHRIQRKMGNVKHGGEISPPKRSGLTTGSFPFELCTTPKQGVSA
jgi:hypothetical protein